LEEKEKIMPKLQLAVFVKLPIEFNNEQNTWRFEGIVNSFTTVSEIEKTVFNLNENGEVYVVMLPMSDPS